ncbi:hypothetical protein DPMN_089509 [Dreissena polymorpha]|uniref:Uncharacterized protein n=1 Tax=Dreissena polymorpha TaxID=45954 RepID=A0A9D4KW31_DREPO|nr:hypothetical protein DPMN_089509 [Dreissena polymorpha]
MRRKTQLYFHRVKFRRSNRGHADMTRELHQLVAKDDVNAGKTLLPKKKFINTKISNKSAHLCMTPSRTNKRKLTPLKSPIKTPFKSPIYKARALGKGCPSSRSLFGIASQVDRLIGTDLDEKLNGVNVADGQTLENTNILNKSNNVVGGVQFHNNLQEVIREM